MKLVDVVHYIIVRVKSGSWIVKLKDIEKAKRKKDN